jgi:hypothetical protein
MKLSGYDQVNLFKYPCVSEKSECHSYSGHSSHVMNVRWTVGKSFHNAIIGGLHIMAL